MGHGESAKKGLTGGSSGQNWAIHKRDVKQYSKEVKRILLIRLALRFGKNNTARSKYEK